MSHFRLLQPNCGVSLAMLCWCRRSEPSSLMERRRNGETDRRRAWLAAASGEPTCRYGMDGEITSSRLSDLLSLLLVPASSAWQDPACPDHNYAPALQPSSTLPFTFYTSLRSSKLISFSETLPSLCAFYTLFDVLICFAEQSCPHQDRRVSPSTSPFSLWFVSLQNELQ